VHRAGIQGAFSVFLPEYSAWYYSYLELGWDDTLNSCVCHFNKHQILSIFAFVRGNGFSHVGHEIQARTSVARFKSHTCSPRHVHSSTLPLHLDMSPSNPNSCWSCTNVGLQFSHMIFRGYQHCP